MATNEGNKSSSATITITEHVLSSIAIYKVIPNLDGSLREYNASFCRGSSSGERASTAAAMNDWAAMYLQLQTDHALGTLPYRWERGHTTAKLVRATINSCASTSFGHDNNPQRQPDESWLSIVKMEGPLLHDTSVSGAEKAATIKQVLNIPQHKPLMETLGEQGRVALIRETATEWELVISHNLLDKLTIQETDMALFQRCSISTNPSAMILPLTKHWKLATSPHWIPWKEDESAAVCCEAIPDLKMNGVV
jgi:hypothetical protein